MDTDTGAIRIGPATAEQGDAVADLWRRTGLTTAYNDPGADFAFARAGAASDVLVALDGERVVATVMVGHDGHRGWLYYVAVDPARQGSGLGQRMVAAAEAWLRDRGVPKVQLLVRATNTGVMGFYDRLGYETSEVRVMQRWLTPDGQPPG
jgi:ribosomal protein S18 acetylase RimI-like enzyme